MCHRIDITTGRLADDITRLRQTLAQVQATSYEVDDLKHVEALGSLTASAQILLADIDAADGAR